MVEPIYSDLCGQKQYLLWDTESGSLHSVDKAAFLYAKNRYSSLTEQEKNEYNSFAKEDLDELSEEFSELEKSGLLNASPMLETFEKKTGEIKSLCLNICHDCNLRCDYCFAGGGTYNTERDYMSFDVGKNAIDMLIGKSGTRRNLEVDFFGGEPLMNIGVVKQIVEYAKIEAAKRAKRFSFTLTTNALLLNAENIEYLNREMDNVVLSIDGRECVHDNVRHSLNGKSVYDVILNNIINFRKVRGDKRYYVRGTFTSRNLDFASDVFYLNDLGFDQISIEPVVLEQESSMALKEEHLPIIMKEYERLAEGYLERRKGEKWFNFFHFMIDLKNGPCIHKRLTGCGAGCEYLAVAPTGDIYPCHQFVGQSEYVMGNVFDKIIDKEISSRFASVNVLKKTECKDCYAKYYCGGGCAANAIKYGGGLDHTYPLACEMTRKRFLLSLAIYASENL